MHCPIVAAITTDALSLDPSLSALPEIHPRDLRTGATHHGPAKNSRGRRKSIESLGTPPGRQNSTVLADTEARTVYIAVTLPSITGIYDKHVAGIFVQKTTKERDSKEAGAKIMIPEVHTLTDGSVVAELGIPAVEVALMPDLLTPKDPASFDRNLQRISRLPAFLSGKIGMDVAEAILFNKDAAQRDHMTNHLIRIFNYLHSKRLDNGNPDKEIYLKATTQQTNFLARLVSDLFEIPQIIEINPAFLFMELNYTNKNVDVAIIFLDLIRQFFVHNCAHQKVLGVCKGRFLEGTRKMRCEFHFKGKIPNHEVTDAYIDALASELSEPF